MEIIWKFKKIMSHMPIKNLLKPRQQNCTKSPAVAGWIPCSERMPEEKEAPNAKEGIEVATLSDLVFVTVKIRDKYHVLQAQTRNGEWFWLTDGFPSSWEVVAWMPFPEPYKNEGWRKINHDINKRKST